MVNLSSGFATLQIVGAPCFRPGGAVLETVFPSMPGSKFTKASEAVKDESEAVVLPYDTCVARTPQKGDRVDWYAHCIAPARCSYFAVSCP